MVPCGGWPFEQLLAALSYDRELENFNLVRVYPDRICRSGSVKPNWVVGIMQRESMTGISTMHFSLSREHEGPAMSGSTHMRD